MYRDKKVVVVMPAYNAAKTVERTYAEVRDQGVVDHIILVDDKSRDETVAVAKKLPGVQVHVHEKNTGYGGNQKTCYRLALEAGADIVIMIHPDYQYTPKLIPAMVSVIANGLYPCVLGSRILGNYALKGGMPLWKYVANRFLTLSENLLLGAKLSEYHTGYRPFTGNPAEDRLVEEFRMILCLITKCWRRFFGIASRSPRLAVPRNILPKLPPSISGGASNTVLVAWGQG